MSYQPSATRNAEALTALGRDPRVLMWESSHEPNSTQVQWDTSDEVGRSHETVTCQSLWQTLPQRKTSVSAAQGYPPTQFLLKTASDCVSVT